jgi:hypothetical protein
MKRCSVCHQEFPFEDCIRLKGNGGRPVFRCLDCAERFSDVSSGESGKRCTYCHITKPAGEFGLRIGGYKGRKSYCRKCEAARKREHRAIQWHGATKEEQAVAKSLYNKALRDGTLSRGECVVCGTNERIHGHHPDYSRPLDVVWLCAKHHAEEHRRIRQDYPPRHTPPPKTQPDATVDIELTLDTRRVVCQYFCGGD